MGRGSANPRYKDGRSIRARLARLPFPVPVDLESSVYRSLSTPDDGLRPHRAVLDAKLGVLLAEDPRDPAAVERAVNLLDGEPTEDELREALANLVGSSRRSDAHLDKVLKTIDASRKAALADARMDLMSQTAPVAMMANLNAFVIAVNRALARAGLAAEVVSAVKLAIAAEMRTLGSDGGRTVMPLEDAFLLAEASGGRGRAARGGDEIEGEALGEDDD